MIATENRQVAELFKDISPAVSPLVIGIDTDIEVIVVSLTTWVAHHSPRVNDLGSSPQPKREARGLWWASQVVNETTMTEIEVSISILSWWNQINDE